MSKLCQLDKHLESKSVYISVLDLFGQTYTIGLSMLCQLDGSTWIHFFKYWLVASYNLEADRSMRSGQVLPEVGSGCVQNMSDGQELVKPL